MNSRRLIGFVLRPKAHTVSYGSKLCWSTANSTRGDHSFSELQPPECDTTPGPAGDGDSVLQRGFYLAGRELVAIDLAGPARLREGVGSAEREFSLLAAKGLCSKREARDACAPF